MHERTFHEDRRGVWRVTWTLAYAFLMVAWLMQRDGAGLWPLFAGIALALLGIGVSALVARREPLLRVEPGGLQVFAGDGGLAGRGDTGAFAIPWSAISGVAFERRRAARSFGDERVMTVETLCFRLREGAPRPDGRRAFLERTVGRESETAVGEHFVWNPQERTLDLLGHPRGGFPALAAAIAHAQPRLGDACAGRRTGLGGPLAYAVYDAGLGLAVVGTLVLWATGRMDAYAALAGQLVAWGGSAVP